MLETYADLFIGLGVGFLFAAFLLWTGVAKWERRRGGL
jgi:hypothetical protein